VDCPASSGTHSNKKGAIAIANAFVSVQELTIRKIIIGFLQVFGEFIYCLLVFEHTEDAMTDDVLLIKFLTSKKIK
jgi:hypothetical protein